MRHDRHRQRIERVGQRIIGGHVKLGFRANHPPGYAQDAPLVTPEGFLALERGSPLKGVPRSKRKPITLAPSPWR